MKATARQTIHAALYRAGTMRTFHRVAHRRQLTVAAFHRVLDPADPRWPAADRTWTVSTPVFAACLEFFERHYTVVSLAEVEAALLRGTPLPRCPLLISFDDGWADNVDYALPLLQRKSMPAVMFAVCQGVTSGVLWQEPVLRAWHEGRLTSEHCLAVWRALGYTPGADIEHLLAWLADLGAVRRRELLKLLQPYCGWPEEREIVTPTQMRSLPGAGLTIASHGFTHTPLALAHDLPRELAGSREFLSCQLGYPVQSLSLPHGSFNEHVIAAAREAGYSLLFTSEACLNTLCPTPRAPTLLGRIPMIAAEFTDGLHRISFHRLARWLFLRPSRSSARYAL